MRTIELLRRSAVSIPPEATVRAAAEIMEASGVGALGVVDGRRLVGIVTDRDLVRRVLATDRPVDGRVDGVMSSPVVTISADADVHEAYVLFGRHAGRRLAVVRAGEFVGMVTLDDLLVDLAAELSELVRPVTGEILFGHRDSPVPAVP